MVLCNVTKQLKGNGLFIDFSQCNLTSDETILVTSNGTNQTIPENDIYDPKGAMTFIVAVVLVYGLAVMGVIALGLLKKKRIWNVDKEAIEFVKHIEEVRRSIDQQTRVGAVCSLLQSLHHGDDPTGGNAGETAKKHLFGKFEMFALPMSPIKEERNNKDENNNDNIEERDIAIRNADAGWEEAHDVIKTATETNPDIHILNGDGTQVLSCNHVTASVLSCCTETEV